MKKGKVFIAIIVILLAVTAIQLAAVIANNTREKEAALPWKEFANADVGDVVTFGTFEGEPIQWDVLDKDEGSVLLISHCVLTETRYEQLGKDKDNMAVTNWKKCALRKYLNGEFYNTSFSLDEQASIQTVKVSNPSSEEFYTIFHPEYTSVKSPKCGETKDKIYLLSWEELIRYYGIEKAKWEKNPDRVFPFSYYAVCTDRDMVEKKGWWLRSPGSLGHYAIGVSEDGIVGDINVHIGYYSVRPVLRVRIR